MKLHEFYAKYANTDLNKRFIALNFREAGIMTLYDIYFELKKIDDKLRTDEIRREKLLSLAQEFYAQE